MSSKALEALVALEGATKQYASGVKALNGVDIALLPGSMSALLGPNGAGKSTALGILAGLVRPGGGTVRFKGQPLAALGPAYRAAIGVVSQHENLDLDLSPVDNLRLHGLLYGLGRSERETRSRDLLQRAALWNRRFEPVRSFSGGMRRKLQIVRALMHQPEILILDEPTVGLDPSNREDVWELLVGLRSEGRTVLFSTHYMEEAQDYADRVSVMDRGLIVREDTPLGLIQEFGVWCRISYKGKQREIEYFDTRPDTELSNPGDTVIVRRTSLYEVFLSLTGRSLS